MISKDITKEEVERFKELLKYLKQLSEDGITPLIEKQLLTMLDYLIPFFSHLVLTDIFPEVNRLTINKNILGSNKRIYDIKYLKYPPADKVTKYGRCNFPKQSVLYCSFLNMTAMNETQPRVGDLVTETVWRVKKNQTLTFCPIFKNQPTDEGKLNINTFNINKLYTKKIKDYPEFIRQQIDNLIQFVADTFTKRVKPNSNLDYLFSAYFSNKILNEFENSSIEAIYYPSVKDKLSFENLAIKPTVFDSKYELVKVSESVCIMDPTNGKGGYFFQGISDCQSFDYASEKILWDLEKYYLTTEELNDFKTIYKLDLSH
jgi:hypothetical protein